jgi:3-phytase
MNTFRLVVLLVCVVGALLCGAGRSIACEPENTIQPVLVSEPVSKDSDDPAIWIDRRDASASMVLGTDKGGRLYAFDLQGKILTEKTVEGLGRPNNVDVEYGFQFDGKTIDIAVLTDRDRKLLRVFSLPSLQPIDGGGIPAFVGEFESRPMGVSLYKRPSDGCIFAVVSRKGGSSGSYLWQYRLRDGGDHHVTLEKVRAFGAFSGEKEIESVVVDDPLGFVYYSDEGIGVRKYLADPDAPEANKELALLAQDPYLDDREGLSIYPIDNSTGYIMVSDQSANRFHIYPREGMGGDPHRHDLLKTVKLATNNSDGSTATSVPLGPAFPNGLFVAMSDDRTFHFYDWRSIAGKDLSIRVTH